MVMVYLAFSIVALTCAVLAYLALFYGVPKTPWHCYQGRVFGGKPGPYCRCCGALQNTRLGKVLANLCKL
jgi:hypothetical protein